MLLCITLVLCKPSAEPAESHSGSYAEVQLILCKDSAMRAQCQAKIEYFKPLRTHLPKFNISQKPYPISRNIDVKKFYSAFKSSSKLNGSKSLTLLNTYMPSVP